MFQARAGFAAACMAALFTLTACGGGGGGGGGGVTPPTPRPTVVSVLFDCGADTTMLPGADRICTAEAMMSDGTKRVVTTDSKTTWTATGPVSVVPGRVTATGPGNAEVTVTYEGKTATVILVVKLDGTPWDQLVVKLTPQEQKVVRDSVLENDGVLYAWDKDTISVWVSSLIPDRDEALDSTSMRWKELTEGKKVFVSARDSATADVHVYFHPPIDLVKGRPCAQAGISSQVNGVAVRGFVQVSDRPGCRFWFWWDLSHEFGHVLGIRRHIPKCNLVAFPCNSWREEESVPGVDFKNIVKFVVWVRGGTKPI